MRMRSPASTPGAEAGPAWPFLGAGPAPAPEAVLEASLATSTKKGRTFWEDKSRLRKRRRRETQLDALLAGLAVPSQEKQARRERRKVMAAQVALRRQQEAQLKRHLAQELMRKGAAPPKASSWVKKGATQPGFPSGKENLAPQPLIPHGAVPLALTPPGKENSHGSLLLSRSPEALPLPWTPLSPGPWAPGHWLPPGFSMPPPVVCRLLCQEPTVPLHPFPGFDPSTSLQLPIHGPLPTYAGPRTIVTAPLSGEHQGPPGLPRTCSTLILQPCGTPDPLLLQPQAPGASHLGWTSAPSERQLQREAAEALMGLKDSSQPPRLTSSVPANSAWISLLHPCGPPAPAGGRGFQPIGPSLRPTPAPSVALHIGCLGSISLLS